jgi:glycosyltransferase involved in cell wall biosynthesis
MSSNPEAGPYPVLHLPASTDFGGAEHVVGELVRRARERGESPRVFALRGTPAERGLSGMLGTSVMGPVAKHPARFGRSDGLRLAAQVARHRRPGELIHAHLPWPDRLGVALLARVRAPLLVTFHLLPSHDILGLGDAVLAPLLDLRRAARLSNKLSPLIFTAVCDEDARRLRQTFPPVRVERVYNCPTAATGPAPPPLPFGNGTRLFAVGQLSHRKGFDRLLRALASEPARSHPFSLCIAGEGDERPALAKLAAELGLEDRVRFVGRVPAPHLYAQADLFLSGSRAEGLPLVLLEAMAAGVAVAVSDIPAHREGVAGIPEALLDADDRNWPAQLARLLADGGLRQAIAERAKQRAELHFSARGQDEAFLALYRELAEASAR